MCKLFYTTCETPDCTCKYFAAEPDYCPSFQKIFTKKGLFSRKPAGKPVWIPILYITRSGIGPFDLVMDVGHGEPPIHFQAEQKQPFRPVGCKRVELVERGVEKDCPLHADHYMEIRISQHLVEFG